MNPRHTSAIIDLALLDNANNRQTSAIQARRCDLSGVDFATEYASIYINLGRAAGHTSYAVRKWKEEGAVLVLSGLADVSSLMKKHQATVDQTRNLYHLSRWMARAKLDPLEIDAHAWPSPLIVFDKGTTITDNALVENDFDRLFWPARSRPDHTYLFLG